MTNLFALCRKDGQLEIKRIQLAQPVQAKVAGIFQAQAATFLDGISEEVEFGGDWKPDPEELLTIDLPEEAGVILKAISHPISVPILDAKNFEAERIKALCMSSPDAAEPQVLIQLFTAQQILGRRSLFMLDGDTFNELTAPVFTLDNYLTAIIEHKKVKFRSFFNLKRIFSLKQFYQTATDQQVEAFCKHPSLLIEDIDSFKSSADEGVRKLVHAITKTEVLNEYPVADVAEKSASLGIPLEVKDGKIAVPSGRKELKRLLRFLDDGIYRAPLSHKRYMTNSKRLLS